MCARCTETEAEPCDVHGHDVPDPDDVCFPDDFVCAVCGMNGTDALADMAARAAAWLETGFQLDRC